MIAVIILPGPSADMLGLDSRQSLSLLPLGDRPILQHIVESLASQRVRLINLIAGHAPDRVETLLGNGDRWGCTFVYHLATDDEHPYLSLRVIESTKSEPWILIHADRFPCISFPSDPLYEPIAYHRARPKTSTNGRGIPGVAGAWGGAAVFPAGSFSEVLCNTSRREIAILLSRMTVTGEARIIETEEWIDATTPDNLLRTQRKLLNRELSGLMINGIEREPGIWISRNVVIHPTVKLTAPVYIGPNCRINQRARVGPDTVIGSHCIVDTNSSIEHALISEGSYVGESLELSHMIVIHNLLVNVRIGTNVEVQENFLLGGIEPQRRQSIPGLLTQAILALGMLILFLPVSMLSYLYCRVFRKLTYTSAPAADMPAEKNSLPLSDTSLPCLGRDAWSIHRAAGWETFVRQFLPGLIAVIAGRVSFCGLPAKTADKIRTLPAEWQALYRDHRIGLISEASVAVTVVEDDMQLYLADAYYTAQKGGLHDLKLALRYFSALVMPASTPNANSL